MIMNTNDVNISFNTPLFGGGFPLPARIRRVIEDPASGHRKDRITPRLRLSGTLSDQH